MLEAPLNLSINGMFLKDILKLFLNRSNVLVTLAAMLVYMTAKPKPLDRSRSA